MLKNVHRSSYKVTVILAKFSGNLTFLDTLSKNTQISNFMKLRPVGVVLFQVDGRTDMNLIVAFRNFPNAPKNQVIHLIDITHV